MFCPQCGAEYRSEILECAECRVALVDALPPETPRPESGDTVPVFRTTSATLLPVITSLLESAGIEYFVQGGEAFGLLPLGPMGSNVSRASLGAIVHVPEADAESVKEMLAEFETQGPAAAEEEFDDGEVGDDEGAAHRADD